MRCDVDGPLAYPRPCVHESVPVKEQPLIFVPKDEPKATAYPASVQPSTDSGLPGHVSPRHVPWSPTHLSYLAVALYSAHIRSVVHNDCDIFFCTAYLQRVRLCRGEGPLHEDLGGVRRSEGDGERPHAGARAASFRR